MFFVRYSGSANYWLPKPSHAGDVSVSTLRDIGWFYLVYPNIEIHHAVRGKSSHELSLSPNLGMKRKFHVRFLGDGTVVMRSCYLADY